MFEGTYTALVTPFRDGEIDEPALMALIADQLAAGVDGLVPCGSTGESATMDHAEHERVIEMTVAAVDGRCKVIAGTGSNNTREACKLTAFAARAGADAALLISPYYNKPTQQGHIDHYRAVADAADLPLIVYNIPGRTGVNMLPDTIAAMAESPNIAGVKEASGDLDQVSRIIAATDDDFEVLSGDDSLTLPMMAVGASGVISVTSNLVPVRFAEMVSAAAAGDFATARVIHHELLALMGALFCETNPIPIKAAMSIAGLAGGMTDEVRLPLTTVTPASRTLLETALRNAGVID